MRSYFGSAEEAFYTNTVLLSARRPLSGPWERSRNTEHRGLAEGEVNCPCFPASVSPLRSRHGLKGSEAETSTCLGSWMGDPHEAGEQFRRE
jgi:hypothetical protein